MLQSNQDLIQTLAGQVATQVAPPVAEEKVAVMPNAICRGCGKDFTKATRNSTLAAIRGHKAHCKK